MLGQPEMEADALLPPGDLIFVGGDKADFKSIGRNWLGTFIDCGGLKPHDRVLDVGCGIGRMAVALAGYLTPPGSYEGFDIVSSGVAWCREHITPRFPQFTFRHADIFNACYNSTGNIMAGDFQFPYPDSYFDFVFLTSVFTHMLPRDVEHYLSEIVRVMAPGSRCLISYFLLSDEIVKRIEAGDPTLKHNFRFDHGDYRTTNDDTPETAVAYHEHYIREKYEHAGLNISEVLHGTWSGHTSARHSQDVVIAS
jgi:ubiquinone/menaquinone biosynthesis C-methylase UbiE